MAEPNILYKITVLNLLSKVDFPLSNAQISDFFLDAEYTDYFTVQQTISDLVDANMIHSETVHNNTQYTLTDEGRKTLELFRDKMTQGIEDDIHQFFHHHKLQMKKENSLSADFYKATGGGYLVHCKMAEDHHNVMDFSFHVPSKAQAEAICTNWKVRYEEVYASLMDVLVQ